MMAVLVALTASNPDGWPNALARTPPMGWRSWSAFGGDVNQKQLERVVDAVDERFGPGTLRRGRDVSNAVVVGSSPTLDFVELEEDG